ncbi:aminoacyl-histidine dipeptidase [uncultured Pontibacter sp.]|uniref:aminoacyl-histidine dipeptidase n=1 Tax=uncultured Pontibacter sp. TaxID=453356 RepID=UPI00262735FF|nr:aminoacyl-histidine dipeptidase [uncultured Pontibacter sp.]
MNTDILELEPRVLWHYFSQLNATPRGTGKEEKAMQFILEVAASKGLQPYTDPAGNVLIRKPATPGMEKRAVLALQAHVDMVHQKTPASDFDFDTQGIQMYQDGDWVKAKETTLGADNGIGVAAILALLTADAITHPPLEALFTVREEKGMVGAIGLPENLLKASAMLNLDSEEIDTITIGCAGRVAIVTRGSYGQVSVPANTQAYCFKVYGLTGGHSGLEIHHGRANAIKLMCKLLTSVAAHADFYVASMKGGDAHNSIPREAEAMLVIQEKDKDKFLKLVKMQSGNLYRLFSKTDPNLKIDCSSCAPPEFVMSDESRQTLNHLINWCPDGIYTMSSDMSEHVQTSNTLSIFELQNGKYEIQCLTRSSVDTEKDQLAQSISGAFTAAGANVSLDGAYSGWSPKPDAAIVRHVASIYKKLFHREPKITAIHAGLECGIICSKYPAMDIASIGPTILGAHTPDERVQISSVKDFWKLLLEILATMPEIKNLRKS